MLWSITTCELALAPIFFFFLEWQGFGFIINWDRCGQGVLPINCTPHISATLYLPCQITQDRDSMGSMWGFESFP